MASRLFYLAIALLTLAMMTAAVAAPAAAGGGGRGVDEAALIGEIALLLLVGRGLGEIMQRFGQPAVIGQLVAGLILGPSLLGWIWPGAYQMMFAQGGPGQKAAMTGLADVGVLMLLLLTGMEMDLKLVRKVGMPAIAVASTGVAVPFCGGFALGELVPDSMLPDPAHRLVAALFLGTALSISSVKIVAMVIREMDFLRRDLGQIIVASAIMEDTVGWVIIALTLGIAGNGGFQLGALLRAVVGVALFLVLSYTIGRKLVFWLIRWVNDSFASDYAVVTAILLVMLAMAAITQAIGVNSVLGAFVAGVLIGESPILSDHIQDQLRGFITAFLMPIFFGLSGLSADLTTLVDPTLALMTLGLIAIASIGKFCGAMLGGRIGGLTGREALALGCGMNARGSTEVIVATIGLSTAALTQNLYTMIVAMAVMTTMAMPPMLRWALATLPLAPDEKDRLQREKIDAKGFASQFERLLVAADRSANGYFASRLAGIMAGRRGLAMTVLEIAGNAPQREAMDDAPTEAKSQLAESARSSARRSGASAEADENEENPGTVEVLTRIEHDDGPTAVAREAEKGFDLLVVGLDRMHDDRGAFTPEVNRLIAGFPGPIAFVMAESGLVERPIDAETRLLIPVNGTGASRAGAEIAFALSAGSGATITALHVSERTALAGERPRGRTAIEHRVESAVLKDVTELGKRYGFEIDTSSHVGITPDAAILKEAKEAAIDLLVIGANRRVGTVLYLGETVSALMQKWQGRLIVVAV